MWHETNKKSPRWGGEGWRPIVCVKPKSNGKQASPLDFAVTPTVTRDARHSPPSPLRKKSRFAEKKSASPKKNFAYSKKWRIVCIKGGMPLPVMTCHNRPSETHRSRFRYLQAALQASPRLHGVAHNMPSPMAGLPLALAVAPSCASGFAFACMEKSRTFSLWEVLIFCNCQC